MEERRENSNREAAAEGESIPDGNGDAARRRGTKDISVRSRWASTGCTRSRTRRDRSSVVCSLRSQGTRRTKCVGAIRRLISRSPEGRIPPSPKSFSRALRAVRHPLAFSPFFFPARISQALPLSPSLTPFLSILHSTDSSGSLPSSTPNFATGNKKIHHSLTTQQGINF